MRFRKRRNRLGNRRTLAALTRRQPRPQRSDPPSIASKLGGLSSAIRKLRAARYTCRDRFFRGCTNRRLPGSRFRARRRPHRFSKAATRAKDSSQGSNTDRLNPHGPHKVDHNRTPRRGRAGAPLGSAKISSRQFARKNDELVTRELHNRGRKPISSTY